MKQDVRVAVIGGGIVGASVFYHPTKAGWKDVQRIERAELTSGQSCGVHITGGMMLAGAEVVRHTRVTDLRQRRDGYGDVVTDKGTVRAEHVVNAGGLWAREEVTFHRSNAHAHVAAECRAVHLGQPAFDPGGARMRG